MLFGSSKPKNYFKVIVNLIWPRTGIKRAVKYNRYRFVRLSGSSYSIAAGFACGVAVSFTPLIGFHFVGAALFAWLIGGNVIASAIGTAIGNPWTFPLIWFWILNLGRWIIGDFPNLDADLEITNTSITSNVKEVLLPMMIGGLIMAPVTWLVSYYPTKYLIVSYRAARKMRLEKKKRKLTGKKQF